MRKPLKTLRNMATTMLVLGIALPSLQAYAEQVRVPIMSHPEARASMDLPRTGQSREAVKARFGSPQDTKGPTGEPPITQWLYDDFVVYFEHNHVIHTVVKPKR